MASKMQTTLTSPLSLSLFVVVAVDADVRALLLDLFSLFPSQSAFRSG